MHRLGCGPLLVISVGSFLIKGGYKKPVEFPGPRRKMRFSPMNIPGLSLFFDSFGIFLQHCLHVEKCKQSSDQKGTITLRRMHSVSNFFYLAILGILLMILPKFHLAAMSFTMFIL